MLSGHISSSYGSLMVIARSIEVYSRRVSFALSATSSLSIPTSFCAVTKSFARLVRTTPSLCDDPLTLCLGQCKLEFPTTCPSCDHSPVEADSCPPNKALRNTMRIWLQKQKKKEETKAASEAPPTPAVDPTPAQSEAPPATDTPDKPVGSVEDAASNQDAVVDPGAVEGVADDTSRQASAVPQREEVSFPATGEGNTWLLSKFSINTVQGSTTAPDEKQHEDGPGVKDAADENQSVEPGQGQDNIQDDNAPNGQIFPSNGMMGSNGMPNQFGFGFNGQGNFGMGMNNMPNMMNPGWNNMGMTSMFSIYRSHANRLLGYGMNNMNNMNNMSGMNGMNSMFGFGGNMGMGMNDMSMNYGGGFGNGWNGMGSGGYGFNGYNQMGGYNQSGAYPEMMNQYPKNHMSNPNRFQGNGPGNFPQHKNRNGSFGGGYGQGAGVQQTSRPGSQNGANNVRRFSHSSLSKPPKASRTAPITFPTNTRTDITLSKQPDGDLSAGTADPSKEKKGNDDQVSMSGEAGQEGKADSAGAKAENISEQAAAEGTGFEDPPKVVEDASAAAPDGEQSSGLNQIQTVDSAEMEDQGFNPSMMGGNMQFPAQMMNSFNPNQMNSAYNHNMGNMGYHNNNFGHRGGFNNAYGAATVLTGEPRGVGVAGAPTGPRAMREGRPNTGFSSRANNIRYSQPPAAPAAETAAASRSPPRRVRS